MQSESHTKVRTEEEHIKTTGEDPQQQGGGGLLGSIKGALGLGGSEKGATTTTTTTGPSADEEVRARVDVAAPTTPSRQTASKVSYL